MYTTDVERLRVTVRGRVQGVGFRAWVADLARDLDLDGYVVNHRDGKTVVAEVQGSLDSLRTFRRLVRRGPPSAKVYEVRAEPVPVTPTASMERQGFTILREAP